MNSKQTLISICIPVFNEATNVIQAVARVKEVFESLSEYRYEIIFTDNHSDDETFSYLSIIAANDPSIRVVRFASNVGYQRSILTGYLLAAGDAVIQLDCDMQDPPELIGPMLEKWRLGADVVYGVRQHRKEGWVITFLRKVFYRALDSLSEEHLPHDAGDFRLLDRKVIEVIRKIDDKSPYLRGMVALIGFRQEKFLYDRAKREHGVSKFNFASLTKLALDAIVSHSSVPLQLASYIGFGLTLIATFLGLIFLVGKILGGADWPSGFATLAILILVNMALTSLLLGIIGLYISRLMVQVRDRPMAVIEASVNLGDVTKNDPRIIDMSAVRDSRVNIGEME